MSFLEFDRVFHYRFTILVQITSDQMKEDWVGWVNGLTYETSGTVLCKVPAHVPLSILTRYNYQSSSETGSARLDNRPRPCIRSCIAKKRLRRVIFASSCRASKGPHQKEHSQKNDRKRNKED